MKKLLILFLSCLALLIPGGCSNPEGEDDNLINTDNNGNDGGENNEAIGGTAEEKKIITLVNQERAKVGLPALKAHNSLMESAKVRAKEVKDTQQVTHIRPDGTSYSTAIKIPVKGSGENIAMGNLPENAMAAWMESTGHKNNILNKNYTHIGVGSQKFVPIIGGYVWVQIFARIE